MATRLFGLLGEPVRCGDMALLSLFPRSDEPCLTIETGRDLLVDIVAGYLAQQYCCFTIELDNSKEGVNVVNGHMER